MTLRRFALHARKLRNIWRVSYQFDASLSEGVNTEAQRAQVETDLNGHALAMTARLADFHTGWQQELPITAAAQGATALVLGEQFAVQLATDGENEGESACGLSIDDPRARFVVELALERQGLSVKGGLRRGPLLWAQCWIAGFAGLVFACAIALRCWSWPKLKQQDATLIAALHAENVNRTKHIRNALSTHSDLDTQVLFVGRPHINCRAARAMLENAGWAGAFVLAWDLPSVLRALPAVLKAIAQAPRAIRAAGFHPGLKALIAIVLRLAIGEASAKRWKSDERHAHGAVFGHTGRADTTLLEAAMTGGGTKTAHWMHGVSTGVHFAGNSDLCICMSEHDARWHDSLLNYRRNTAFALPKPAFRTGTKTGWVVMTNMTHPAYPFFASIGPAHELHLIAMLEKIALAQNVPGSLITWKPHPVFYQQDPTSRRLVSERLQRAGFTLWPEPAMPFDLAADFEQVIVTPSGVALDMLKVGRLPIMASFQPLDPDHSLAQIAPAANNIESMTQALDLARDAASASTMFDDVWSKVGPGGFGSLDQVEAELLSGQSSE